MSAPVTSATSSLPSSSAAPSHPEQSTSDERVASSLPAPTIPLVPASVSLSEAASSVLSELQAQSEAGRVVKSTPKAVYNRSYVRGFARPPPPEPSDAAAATADSASPAPPPFVAAEDDPTSNHYQAPIFRQPLSLAQLIDICSDAMILSSLPTPGIHVTRLTAQGKPREYVMYRCSVCGKEVGDKSKHKKHEASCKKRILKMLNAAEKDEERRKHVPVTMQVEQGDKEKVKEEKRRKRAVAAPAGAALTTDSLACSRSGAELSASKLRQPAIEKSEMYQSELKKQLKWIWHTMDVNPATCLLSRDSVLARIDLSRMFTEGADGLDLFSALNDDEQASLQLYLPHVDQAAQTVDSNSGVKQEFPASRKESVLSTLRSTLASPVFVRSLDEYKRMLMSGSLDPALKGLRMMASARRRRQQREAGPDKQTEQEVYWGEKLSESTVKVVKALVGRNGRALLGGWRGLLGKKHKAVPAGPGNIENGQAKDARNGTSLGGEDEEQAEDEGAVNDEEKEERQQDDEDQQSDRTASDTDTDARASEDTDEDVKSADDDEETNGHDENERGGRRPLHQSRRRPVASSNAKRSKRRSSSRSSRSHQQSNSEHYSDSSPYSPLHIDSLLPLPLQLKLPAPSLPDIVPSIQRFHMRSPRFRRMRYARFVLKDGRSSLIDARDVAASSSPPSSRSSATAHKQRLTSDHSLSPPTFSHLQRSIAQQCMELQRQMMSAEEKQAAQQRIAQARSVRVRQMEQDRLSAAMEAEAQLLQLVEETATESNSGSTRRKDKRREREDNERQQRITHGMKRPRGRYDDGEGGQSMVGSAEDDKEEDEEDDEQQRDEAEEEESADGGTTAMAEDGSGSEDQEPLSRLVGNGMEQTETRSQRDGEHEGGENVKQAQSRQETHLYTPVFPRSKFGFSSFVKQAVGNHV